jgi:hypothetical protein
MYGIMLDSDWVAIFDFINDEYSLQAVTRPNDKT